MIVIRKLYCACSDIIKEKCYCHINVLLLVWIKCLMQKMCTTTRRIQHVRCILHNQIQTVLCLLLLLLFVVIVMTCILRRVHRNKMKLYYFLLDFTRLICVPGVRVYMMFGICRYCRCFKCVYILYSIYTYSSMTFELLFK